MAEAAALAGLGWVASPIISMLVNKSISYLGSDIAKGLDDLETTLLPQIQLTIEAAQHSPHKAKLAKWLARLKNAYFDAEAILHELEYESLKRKAKGDDKKLLVRLSSKPIIKPLAKFVDRAVKKASLLSPQKRELLQRLNELKTVAAEAKNLRDLLGIQNTGSIQNAGNNTFVTTSLLGNADKVFGRDGDRDEIISFLLNEQLNEQESSSPTKRYSVVAITGMGGAGKTTLAQYVYNDPRVQHYFDVRMWLCLSQKFDTIEVTKEMIESASGKCPDLCNLNNLQVELVKQLPDNKKVMVVLDDIWYENNDGAAEKKQWENLLKPFDSQGGTCKIVVTSRSSRSFPIELEPGKLIPLSDLAPDDFKSLLRYRAIDGLQFSDLQLKNRLSDIVDQIAKKLSKSPLAAKVVGNQLHKQPDIVFWRATLENVDLSDTRKILLWSFHRFDVQLQRCFLFCSIFSKGSKLSPHALVAYWVALDFIQPSDNNRDVELIGMQYIQIMVANSIFHQVDQMCFMHDLFHDLAEKLSTEDCIRVTNATKNVSSTVQHVNLMGSIENLKENLSSICNLSNLRTLILVCPFIDDISEIIHKISINFRNLRVLNIRVEGYKTLPKVVGDLRNLRFLNIWMSSIEELPDSMLRLYHLQYLSLPSSINTLPAKLSNLIKLRSIQLFNREYRPVNTLPPVPYLGTLTSLQHLDEFHVRKEKGYELHQLGQLKEIGGTLRIVNLENVRDKDEAIEARLIEKPKLELLQLVWSESAENGSEIEVIEALRPPANLEFLTIVGYKGSTYPTWFQEGSFRENIRSIKFSNCNALKINFPNFHQFRHCCELILENLGTLRELSTFQENLTRLVISKCPCLIFVCENELQVNENQSIMESRFLTCDVGGWMDILGQEFKSFEQTGSKENCAEQLRIIKSAAWGNAPEHSINLNVNKAWWCCHQQRMNFIFGCNPLANKLNLPSKLRILSLEYCCVSDVALSNCLRGMVTLEELYLQGIMTITTLPPAQVLKFLKMLRIIEISNCWYLRSLGGLHAVPHLERFWIEYCWCLEMESGDTPLPPTLHSFIIHTCSIVPETILNEDFPCLQDVVIDNCLFSTGSLSFRPLTSLKSLILLKCPGLFSIQGLESRPFIDCLVLLLLPNLDVESVLQSWQGCRLLCISSSVMLTKLFSSQDFVPPQDLLISESEEEAISFEKSNHLQSVKKLQFSKCKNLGMINALSEFSTLEQINFLECPEISGLPELPGSIQRITIRGCTVLGGRCKPNGQDWHKIQCIPNRWIE